MQAEIDAGPPISVAILGVNAPDAAAGVPDMVSGRTIPLLQDEDAVDAAGLWDVTPRDVVVLDPSGRAYAVYNLTANDLSVPANYATLKQLLLDAAAVPP
jgi:hypothetical protein